MGAIFLVIASLVFVGYVLLAIYSTTWVQNRFASKWPARLTILFWVLLPTWDSILALGYHRYICATDPEVGLHVYNTIKLDPKLFDPKTGRPMIYNQHLELDKSIVGNRLATEFLPRKGIGNWPFKVIEFGYRVIDKESGITLTQYKDYYEGGGAWWGAILAPLLTGGAKAPQCIKEETGRGYTTITLEAAFSKQ